MAIRARFLSDEVCPSCGRRKVCEIHDGEGGGGRTPLEELGANYEPCECATCAKELIMEDVIVGPKDLLKFSHGAGTGAELGVKDAGDQLVALKEQEKARLKASHPSLSDAEADAEAWARTKRVNGDLMRRYTNTAATQRDIERRPAGGEVVVEHGTAVYHIDRTRRYHSDDFLLPLPEGVSVGFVPVPGAALPGTQRPNTITFLKAWWTRAKAEAWLGVKGLIASQWDETFSLIEATIYAGAPSGEPRVVSTAEGKLPTSPLLEKLRKLQEHEKLVSAEIKELARLMNINYFEALQIVLDDPRHADLPTEIREKLERFWGPPTLQ